MANFSSSNMDNNCVNCNSDSDALRSGWPLSSGGFAMLCNRCASAYDEGIFCNVFHLRSSGWRFCATCQKGVHCGCIMSYHTYIELDIGGVKCIQCIGNDESIGPVSRNAPPQTLEDRQEPSEVVFQGPVSRNALPRTSEDLQEPSDRMINGRTQGVPSQDDAPSHEKGKQVCTELPDAADTHFESPRDGGEHQVDSPGKTSSYRRYSPGPSEEEIFQIKKDSNSVVVPLFEKVLTFSDADPKNGRLIVPKKCAQEYMPKLTSPEGIVIEIQDTNGNDWAFNYRFWLNNNSTMYVLEGIKDYLVAYGGKAGDKVTFYRIDPEGKLALGLKKSGEEENFKVDSIALAETNTKKLEKRMSPRISKDSK